MLFHNFYRLLMWQCVSYIFRKTLKHMRINNGKSPAARSDSAFHKTFANAAASCIYLLVYLVYTLCSEWASWRSGFSLIAIGCAFVYVCVLCTSCISFVRLHFDCVRPNCLPSKRCARQNNCSTFLNASTTFAFICTKAHVDLCMWQTNYRRHKFINRKIYLLDVMWVCVCVWV